MCSKQEDLLVLFLNFSLTYFSIMLGIGNSEDSEKVGPPFHSLRKISGLKNFQTGRDETAYTTRYNWTCRA